MNKSHSLKIKLICTFFALILTIFSFAIPNLANAAEGAGGVSVREISNLNIVSDDSTMPVTIVNSTKLPLQMYLYVTTDSMKLDIDSPSDTQSDPIEVPANSESIISVPLHARANGVAQIHIVCRGINAVVYADYWVQATVTTTIGKTLFVLFIAFVALLLVFGIYRTVRAHKNSPSKRSSTNLFGIKK